MDFEALFEKTFKIDKKDLYFPDDLVYYEYNGAFNKDDDFMDAIKIKPINVINKF